MKLRKAAALLKPAGQITDLLYSFKYQLLWPFESKQGSMHYLGLCNLLPPITISDNMC